MSEGELHLICARLNGGLRNKAERGELVMHLPVGFDRDEDDRIVLSVDEQVWPPDRATVRAVAPLRVGRSDPRRVDRRRAAPPAPIGWRAARAIGPPELWRGPQAADQPGTCRRVRVRPLPPGEACRRQRRGSDQDARGADGEVVCLPAWSPSWLCQLGGICRYPQAAARQRETAWRGWRRGPRRRRVAAGGPALRALRAPGAGRVFRQRRPPRQIRLRVEAPARRAGERGCATSQARREAGP